MCDIVTCILSKWSFLQSVTLLKQLISVDEQSMKSIKQKKDWLEPRFPNSLFLPRLQLVLLDSEV